MKEAQLGDIVMYRGCEAVVCGVGQGNKVRVTASSKNQNIRPDTEIEYGDSIGEWLFLYGDSVVGSTLSDFEGMDNHAFASVTCSVWSNLAQSK